MLTLVIQTWGFVGVSPEHDVGFGIGPGAVFDVEGEPLIQLVGLPVNEGENAFESGAGMDDRIDEEFIESKARPLGSRSLRDPFSRSEIGKIPPASTLSGSWILPLPHARDRSNFQR